MCTNRRQFMDITRPDLKNEHFFKIICNLYIRLHFKILPDLIEFQYFLSVNLSLRQNN